MGSIVVLQKINLRCKAKVMRKVAVTKMVKRRELPIYLMPTELLEIAIKEYKH
jgi:hypothetical protein